LLSDVYAVLLTRPTAETAKGRGNSARRRNNLRKTGHTYVNEQREAWGYKTKRSGNGFKEKVDGNETGGGLFCLSLDFLFFYRLAGG
jgi:hypothetical protein